MIMGEWGNSETGWYGLLGYCLYCIFYDDTTQTEGMLPIMLVIGAPLNYYAWITCLYNVVCSVSYYVLMLLL